MAASVTPATPDWWGGFATQRWELFNTEADPSECHDLAESIRTSLATRHLHTGHTIIH